MRDHESYGTQGEAKRVHAQRTEAYNDPVGKVKRGRAGEERERQGGGGRKEEGEAAARGRRPHVAG